MAAENKNYTETEIMLGALDRIVREEMKKKPSKRDDKLIDECIAEMAKLKNVRAGYTEEEIGAIVEKLQETAANKPKQEPVRRKSVRRMAAVVCAVCLIMVGSVAAVAWRPLETVREWIYSITNTPSGIDTKIEDITYTNHGKYTEYDDIQELLRTEKLNVYYPSVLPDTVSITRVEPLMIDSEEYINFHFSDSNFKFIIQLNAPLYLNIPQYEIIKTDDITFYLSYQNGRYIARCNIDSNLYLVECSDYQDILLIINHFTKGY